MNRALKWTLIIIGVIVVIALAGGGLFYEYYTNFGTIPSGGVLSENQASYDVHFYDINLIVDGDAQTISGYTSILISSVVEALDKVELDLLSELVVESVSANDKELNFERPGNKLWVNLDAALGSAEQVELKITYAGSPMEAIRPPWRGGFNWSKDSNDDHWIGLSCQGEGAKVWIPCKDHPSDEPDSAAINITVPKPYVVASNGLLEGIEAAEDDWHTYRWFTRYPINNYNINISIAKYDVVERDYMTEDSSEMPVVFYVLPEDRENADKILDMTVDMLTELRKYLGEYPFTNEKFGLAHTDYLGMEHQTINAYGNHFRYDSVATTEYDWLLLHEMIHEWWGNKVSVNDWADFWIHEGICVYSEALYHREKGGEDAYHAKMQRTQDGVSNRSPVIPKRPATTTESYTGDVYAKGACFMHTLRYVVGDSIFFPTLKQFMTDSAYTYQNRVATSDLLKLVNRNSGMELDSLFHMYLETTRLPRIQIEKIGEEDPGTDTQFGFTYEISIPNIGFEIPMDVTVDGQTERMILGKSPQVVYAGDEPEVDLMRWYLLEE